jgi:LacI family repressor for deo operon, udp, cdd, tsx, nupC, and nupG
MTGLTEISRQRVPAQFKVRLQEVALESGYSIGTVSRALSSPRNLSPSTVAHVRAVAERLGYRPNMVARALKMGESKCIYVICPRISCFFPEIIRGIEGAALEFGYSILIAHTERDPELEGRYMEEISAGRADGALLLSMPRLDDKFFQRDEAPPIVSVLDSLGRDNIPSVRINHARGAEQAVEHLVALGHRRIAHITGDLKVALVRERQRGFVEAMNRAGLEPVCIPATFSSEAGQAAMAELLTRAQKPTAVFAGNDEIAAGAIAAIRGAGLKVPDDVSVVGHDDQPLSRLYDPQITTVHVPSFEVGYQAMKLLRARLFKEVCEPDTLLPTRVMARATTAPPPANS